MLPRVQNIKGFWNRLGVFVDILMLGLTIFDLCWLMFDALYNTATVKAIVDPILPFYDSIHADFYFYDGIIVSVFILEFVGKWLVSIYRQRYDKWFFYPFVNWYDVLGCFPTGSFRILRLFRIIGLTYRLHQWGVIDLNHYAVFKTLAHYYNIAIEEVSDRVVVKVLSQAKKEVQRGQPLSDAIVQQVIKPKKAELAQLLATVIQDGIRDKYPQYRTLLQKHIQHTVKDTVSNNEEVQQIGRIPIVGGQIQTALNTATSQIVFGVIDRLIQDSGEEESAAMLALVFDSVLDVLLQHQQLQNSELGNQLVLESIDLIIERVRTKQWKLRDEF